MLKKNILTDVAGESGPDLAPQNFLFNLGTLWNEKICMQARICLPCLVPENDFKNIDFSLSIKRYVQLHQVGFFFENFTAQCCQIYVFTHSSEIR